MEVRIMMRGINFCEIGCLMFASCMLACLVAVADDERPDAEPQGRQTDAENGSGESEPRPRDVIDGYILSEIEQIRRRLDANPFRGTILEDVQPADLKPENCPPRAGGGGETADGFHAAIGAVAVEEAGRGRRGNGPPEMGARHLTPVVAAGPASVLRQAARTLEDGAADLDDAGLYPEADRLRLLADQFWQRAREFDGRRRP
jgi:hypothetical protein